MAGVCVVHQDYSNWFAPEADKRRDTLANVIPREIDGVGDTQSKPRVSPRFDPVKAGLSPQEYFILSRIDGQQTTHDVIVNSPLGVDRTIAILQRLASTGALVMPGAPS